MTAEPLYCCSLLVSVFLFFIFFVPFSKTTYTYHWLVQHTEDYLLPGISLTISIVIPRTLFRYGHYPLNAKIGDLTLPLLQELPKILYYK